MDYGNLKNQLKYITCHKCAFCNKGLSSSSTTPYLPNTVSIQPYPLFQIQAGYLFYWLFCNKADSKVMILKSITIVVFMCIWLNSSSIIYAILVIAGLSSDNHKVKNGSLVLKQVTLTKVLTKWIVFIEAQLRLCLFYIASTIDTPSNPPVCLSNSTSTFISSTSDIS